MYKTKDEITREIEHLSLQLANAEKRDESLEVQLNGEQKKWANDCSLLNDKVAILEVHISCLRAQLKDLSYANKNLEDELAKTKVKVDRQCDETANEALGLACKIFQAKYKDLDLGWYMRGSRSLNLFFLKLVISKPTLFLTSFNSIRLLLLLLVLLWFHFFVVP